MAIQFPRPDAGSVRPGFRREIWSQPDGHSTAELYDEMFRRRAQDYPEALTLDFWTNHPVTEAVRRHGVTGQCLLDCGCGTGEISIHLARASVQVTAYDLSPVALSVARRHLAQEPASVRAALHFVEGREGPLPFESHSFDTILLSHVLEHVAHPGPLLKDLARLLCPGGSLLIFTPRERFYDAPTHVHHFTRDALAELLNNYFEHVTATGIDDDRQLFAVCSNSTARDYPRMICQMRIKNEERWLNDVLDQIALVADGVVILDDGSTDNTPALCAAHPAVIGTPIRPAPRSMKPATRTSYCKWPCGTGPIGYCAWMVMNSSKTALHRVFTMPFATVRLTFRRSTCSSSTCGTTLITIEATASTAASFTIACSP
ncbi:MAG: methyltransferase domain-containing protein [bacterium]|nr:methyltransferase domain-containing protein [bacterium]